MLMLHCCQTTTRYFPDSSFPSQAPNTMRCSVGWSGYGQPSVTPVRADQYRNYCEALIPGQVFKVIRRKCGLAAGSVIAFPGTRCLRSGLVTFPLCYPKSAELNSMTITHLGRILLPCRMAYKSSSSILSLSSVAPEERLTIGGTQQIR